MPFRTLPIGLKAALGGPCGLYTVPVNTLHIPLLFLTFGGLAGGRSKRFPEIITFFFDSHTGIVVRKYKYI